MNAARIGLQLSRLRRQARMTQAELAGKMGTDQSVISRLEAGHVTPTLRMVDRFVSATGIPLSIRFGAPQLETSPATRRERLNRVMGAYTFNPWERNPSEAEARSLNADGLTYERFNRDDPARTSGRRT